MKKKLKSKEDGAVLVVCTAGGIAVSDLVSWETLFETPAAVMGGMLAADSEFAGDTGVCGCCFLVGEEVWGVTAVEDCISAVRASEDVFILGGVGGMGLVGGVGACMDKTPFIKNRIIMILFLLLFTS